MTIYDKVGEIYRARPAPVKPPKRTDWGVIIGLIGLLVLLASLASGGG